MKRHKTQQNEEYYNNTTVSEPHRVYKGGVYFDALGNKEEKESPQIIKSQHGNLYEKLPVITLDDIKELQEQTGFVVPLLPGKKEATFIGDHGYFGQFGLCRNLETGQYYGIKEIGHPDKLQESLGEAEIQLILSDLPNIMPLVDYAELKDPNNRPIVLYHVMPLAALGNGEQLAEYLKRFDESYRKQILPAIARDILTAFLGIHQNNIAHLDFRSANFVVDQAGNLMVIDFGCAKRLNEAGEVAGNAQGHLSYCPPERLRAIDTKETFSGKAADLWAIGVTLLEVAVGKLSKEEYQHPEQHPFLKNPHSDYAKLILALIQQEPQQRLMVEQALKSPFLRQETPPEIRAYLREFVQTAQLMKMTPETQTAETFSVGNPSQLPLPHFTSYVNRSSIETSLRTFLLSENDYAHQIRITACYGPGGMGKTQTAIYLIHDPQIQQTFRTFWFDAADSKSNIALQMKALAQTLGLIDHQTVLEQALSVLKEWLENQFSNTGKPLLLVFDNADDPQLLQKFLPKKGVHVFVTSRSPQWPHGVAINKMTKAEVKELFTKLFPGEKILEKNIDALVKELDFSPLATKQAIAQMREEGISIEGFLQIFLEKKQQLLATKLPLFGKNLPHSIMTLYQVQLIRLQKEFPQALKLLQYSAFLAADHIPEFLLETLLEKKDFKEIYKEARKVLTTYGIWQWHEESQTISLHRLTQEVVRGPITPDIKEAYFRQLLIQLNIHYWLEGNTVEKNSRQRQFFSHQYQLKLLIEGEMPLLKKSVDWASLLTDMAYTYFLQFRQPAQAKEMLNQSLDMLKQQLMQDLKKQLKYQREHVLKAAQATAIMGLVAWDLGSGEFYSQIKPLKQAISIFKTYLGKENFYATVALTGLGLAYYELGHFKQAQFYLEDSIKNFGNREERCLSLAGLGAINWYLGNLLNAQHYFKRAIELGDSFIGFVPTCNSFLGMIDVQTGDAEGKTKLENTLQKMRTIYGLKHRLIILNLYHLGEACRLMMLFTEATKYLNEAQKIQEELGGKNHPIWAHVLVMQAKVAQDQKQYEKAKELLQNAQQIFQNTHKMGKKSFYIQQVNQMLKSLPKTNKPLYSLWSQRGSQHFQPKQKQPDESEITLQEQILSDESKQEKLDIQKKNCCILV